MIMMMMATVAMIMNLVSQGNHMKLTGCLLACLQILSMTPKILCARIHFGVQFIF